MNTDSLSALHAIGNMSSLHPLIMKTHQLIDQVETDNIEIILTWIPAHQGIQGNETVDQATKQPIEMNISTNIEVTHQEVTKHIHNRLLEYWDKQWRQLPPTMLYSTRYSIYEKPPILNRKQQCSITRLRIGHPNFSHIYLFTKDNPKECPRCKARITVRHLLIDCKLYQAERIKYRLPPNSKSILNDKDNSIKIISFIQNIVQFI